MKTNLLVAITNLVKNPVISLGSNYHSINRANNMGDALEEYVKDLFCGIVGEKNIGKKDEVYSQNFSYLGNQNNPPDVMIREGDAIEIKKLTNFNSGLALNSSYPKDKIYADSSMITEACRTAEKWEEKDLIYVVGVAKGEDLQSLWFVYGDCYAADKKIYERISESVKNGISKLSDVEISSTNELGRVNKVDPLGITYLRIRGMWGIENPVKVFASIAQFDPVHKFSMHALMLQSKYNAFPADDKKNLEGLIGDNFTVADVKIKSPNNPAILLEAKLLTFIKP
jgi:hypothetical protein